MWLKFSDYTESCCLVIVLLESIGQRCSLSELQFSNKMTVLTR